MNEHKRQCRDTGYDRHRQERAPTDPLRRRGRVLGHGVDSVVGFTASTNAPVQSRNPLKAVRCALNPSESISQKYGTSSARILLNLDVVSSSGLAIDRLGPEVEQLVDPRVAVTSTIGKRKWTDVRGDVHASNADIRISTVAERGEPQIECLFHEHLLDRRIEVERLQIQGDADLTAVAVATPARAAADLRRA